MIKLQKRAIICIFFALILIFGSSVYVYKFLKEGSRWASYPANEHIYNNGKLAAGKILDRNNIPLFWQDDKGDSIFAQDLHLRKAMLHGTGDKYGNIATGGNVAFRSQLIGYNLLSGVFSLNADGNKIKLTLDGELSKFALSSLDGYSGTVGVYNYKTGEILCMVSSPSYDPLYPPNLDSDDNSGIFMNRLLSAKYTPGSIFKVVSSAVYLENIPDISNWSYTCTGEKKYGNSPSDKVTCIYAHGRQDFNDALANSCNCGFADLSEKIDSNILEKYVKKYNLTSSYNIDGIPTSKGSFEFSNIPLSHAWTTIGQHKNLINPLSMMVFAGAIGGGGTSGYPHIIKSIDSSTFWNFYTEKEDTLSLMEPDTATKLQAMMKNNVISGYGEWNFNNLDIYGKTGTAEHIKGQAPHSLFFGFIKDEAHPYAFIVIVENGGAGNNIAMQIASRVMQKAITLK